ncbi:APC family permease [Mycolicibacterium rhodesiae]|uniref:APC family permease n=1 Tax=Mycolicibacterium rhodesiae TaxID=36814 RepID=UPI0021F2DFA9|nr:APC family permease [Mycolicibacterium rhodesiae]MCV7344199.1 APC family permease [Mycolicibacterium rhodesiae]
MAQDTADPAGGLRSGALRAVDVVVMALASSGPIQSVAVSLAAILATVAYAGFVPILICFVPMLGIALGYQRLHAWQPSAGATYTWVGRVLNPHAGFFAGWIMLLYYTVGTTSLTIPLGSYLLSFFSDHAADSPVAVAAVGTVFDLIVTAVAALGVALSARFQLGWAIFEYALLIGSRGNGDVVKPSMSWFTVEGAGGFKSLISGVLLAIFLYSGWDTAAYVGEEAAGRTAGRAAVTSVVLLFVIYSVSVLAFQGIAPMQDMQDHAANILAFVGERIGGGFWANVMIVAVLGGTLASLLAAIVSASRIGFAMGRDRVVPSWLAQVSGKYGTPLNATILFGLLNIAFLWGSTLIGAVGEALANIVSTLGLMAAIFYLLTAVTAIWCYRRQIASSAKDFVIGGLMPGLGAAFMAFVVVYSITSGSLNGIELGFGVGLALAGIVLSVISAKVGKAPFYTAPRTPH